ncbi:GntR family transcriptional regulator [Arthrobacter sp. B2a2-09]|uniref:GntR family transcriptional regulator n=1 Tax=Arthrobacter sp. B2a2-09 TaxID=2952822 RepID=UPI0022CD53C3|nr:GntR family transcriptional regulator [Arthrobacter sp. B2a2-09]MCZ9882582.1 GntR family transcriptional regulator [Arthrobacter sp. B2a2-09]
MGTEVARPHLHDAEVNRAAVKYAESMTTAPHYPPQRPLKPRRNLREEVAESLRNRILSGEFKPGVRIDLVTAAEELGISQLPVREALITLEGEGLVKSYPRRGYFVQALQPEDILDHYEIFGKVAGMAAARAAKTLSGEQLKELTAINEAMRAAKDPEKKEDCNFKFHKIINGTGSSHRLMSVIRILSKTMSLHFGEIIPDWDKQAADEHDEILDALRQGDPQAARIAMENHLSVNGVRAVEALHRMNFFPEP